MSNLNFSIDVPIITLTQSKNECKTKHTNRNGEMRMTMKENDNTETKEIDGMLDVNTINTNEKSDLKSGMIVKKIDSKMTHDFILRKHYAQRLPSISFAFGLFVDDILEGVLTIGKPASRPLCVGICGEEYAPNVYELNRLITNEGLPENSLSFFVARCLRALKHEDLIIVSYADTGMNHHGYIYQATNFLYTGVTKGRTDKYVPGNKHPRHYTEEFNHLRKVRTGKHRYVYFTNKKNVEMRSSLRYPIEPYPKGDNGSYLLGERITSKIINKITGEEFYE